MEIISIVAGLVIGVILGCIIGWALGRRSEPQPLDLSGQAALLANMNSQVAEMRGKFLEMERARTQIEQSRAQYDAQREQRIVDWMNSTRQFFIDQTTKMQQVDGEKDKRIQAWMESTGKFFEEQRTSYTKFLEQQGKSREEIELKRDAQIRDMSGMIQQFTRTIAGTKTRGMVGEEQLREALANSIRAGVIECNLRTGTGEVEFAWNLEDGKYIPIDCKLPDVFELLDQYAKSEDIAEQKALKSEIGKKIEKEIKTIQKYQNQTNTIDVCILVVPEGVLEAVPEIVGLGRESNVFICSYKDVFPVAYLLQEKYQHFREQGDVGAYQQMIKTLFQILSKIEEKTDAIQKALTTIMNANGAIKKQIMIARQTTPMGIETEVELEDS